MDATAAVGVAPWTGGEAWIDTEMDQGFGLSDTLGVAGFTSVEAYKVGRKQPSLRVQRFLSRQTLALGGDAEAIGGEADRFAATQTADRLVVAVGGFGVGDVFDTNRYAHDPRGDFLNWASVDAGSFDFAADGWGCSLGVAAEWYAGPWTLRLGLFDLSTVPNGTRLERGFGQSRLDVELEHRHRPWGRDGAVRLPLFRHRGRFGRFADALALAAADGGTPDTAPGRARRTRLGAHLDLEQAMCDAVGLFARAGLADGAVEPYDFTDIDRTASAGIGLDGTAWGRDGDEVGLAGVADAISAEHRRHLAAGGLGVLVGNGRLPHPGAGPIGEAYPRWQALAPVAVTLDHQRVARPGHNRDRGPADMLAVRPHGGF